MADKDLQEKVNKLQLIEQNLNNFLAQRQQFQTQLFELDNALKEMKTSSKTFKIIGSIMVAAEPAELEKDLSQKKELMELRISSIDKQERQLRDKAKDLQEEVLSRVRKE